MKDALLIALLSISFALTSSAGFIIRKVATSGGIVIDEDFAETGTPSSGTWTSSGTVDWDSTAHSTMNGQALQLGSADTVWVDVSSPVEVKCIYETSSAPSITSSLLSYISTTGAGAPGTVLQAMQSTTGAKVQFLTGGSASSASSTFTITANTKYYITMRFAASSTCYFGIATTDIEPGNGTDTATAFGVEKTGGATEALSIRMSSVTGVNMYYDDLTITD